MKSLRQSAGRFFSVISREIFLRLGNHVDTLTGSAVVYVLERFRVSIRIFL